MTNPCRDRAHSPEWNGKAWRCDDCTSGLTVSARHRALSAALEARDRGMALTTAAHPDDAGRVEAAIRQLAATGQPFSSNDARPIHGVKGAVVGATFQALKKQGVIRPVGDVTSTDRGTHGHRVYLWQGAAA